ncbi:MAG: glycosyltransferase family 1 protein [Candidatus Pelagibacter sp.]|nr:glycosyltransferase family 1 protein [Candidatus Pelagibacter sp.]|tara:strand:- start:143 stop:1279 length:1137 start_codon:yes stop_codon:yes gene_type:complete
MNKTLLILVSHVSFFISHRLDLAIAAKNMGYKVKIAFGELDADTKYLKDIGIDIFHVPIQRGGLNLLKDLKSLYSMWCLFRKVRPDILHLVTIKPYLYGGVLARLLKIPSVVTAISGLGSLFINNNYISQYLRLLLVPFYRFALNHSNQRVIVQNKEDAKVLVKMGVLNIQKVKLIRGSGVKLEEFNQLDETGGIPTVCFAARLLVDKGLYDFVAAANLLKNRGVQARFCLAGDLDRKNPTGISKKELNELKENKNIEVLGHQKDMATLYAKSHVVCLPSYREGLPKALIEAAAASRAIVTTNVPGCRDAIIPNKTGLLVPVNDPKKLANAIQWLIEHPEERIIMGKSGRQLAVRDFQIKKIIKKHLDIYKELSENIL